MGACTVHKLPPPTEAHLQSGGTRITNDYTATARHLSTSPEIEEYFRDKYKWHHNTIQDIAWHAHGTALRRLKGRKYKTTIQFIHQWLPVNTSHSTSRLIQARLCPYCMSSEETQQHYLTCQHKDLQDQWKTAAIALRKKLLRYHSGVHHQILQLLHRSMTEWRATPNPIRPPNLNPNFYPLFQRQSEIGWDQVLKGRLTTEWLNVVHTKSNMSWFTYVNHHDMASNI
jgi:hypothetical protein